jgi:hypothetical protein
MNGIITESKEEFCNLGIIVYEGKLAQKEYSLAYDFFLQGHEKKEIDSTFNLAYMTFHGEGCEQNKKEAVDLFLSVDDLFPEACHYIGLYYCEMGKPGSASVYFSSSPLKKSMIMTGKMYLESPSCSVDWKVFSDDLEKLLSENLMSIYIYGLFCHKTMNEEHLQKYLEYRTCSEKDHFCAMIYYDILKNHVTDFRDHIQLYHIVKNVDECKRGFKIEELLEKIRDMILDNNDPDQIKKDLEECVSETDSYIFIESLKQFSDDDFIEVKKTDIPSNVLRFYKNVDVSSKNMNPEEMYTVGKFLLYLDHPDEAMKWFLESAKNDYGPSYNMIGKIHVFSL